MSSAASSMDPTVLAGPVEFSPADIAFILAVLAVAALLVSAPGWAVLAFVMGRRPGPAASPGRRWRARVGGAVLGIALSAAVAASVGALLNSVGQVVAISTVAAWVSCWGLAAALLRSAPKQPGPATAQPSAGPRGEGWGR